ncbi:flavodoxin domain-containing protein [Streptomyces sp. NBC_01283]|uniref:flavodoxin domain-containing protein n=1 Tax=Streptomyces sp. NBC_01283 TaxID=2903812 RepID=UPI00352EB641|nr:flavodoxin domain-containing protein [Streptomyces sp. NBC_01283]
MNILVGYSGVHGSTHGIAERLATRLAECGHVTVVVPLVAEQKTGGYDAFVLGSAVHHGAWLGQATDFIRSHPSTLATHPTWLYSVGVPPHAGRWPARRRPEPRQLAGIRSLIRPWGHQLLAGAIYRDHVPGWRHLAFRACGGRYGDHRDWKAVDDWVERIHRRLVTADTTDSAL